MDDKTNPQQQEAILKMLAHIREAKAQRFLCHAMRLMQLDSLKEAARDAIKPLFEVPGAPVSFELCRLLSFVYVCPFFF